MSENCSDCLSRVPLHSYFAIQLCFAWPILVPSKDEIRLGKGGRGVRAASLLVIRAVRVCQSETWPAHNRGLMSKPQCVRGTNPGLSQGQPDQTLLFVCLLTHVDLGTYCLSVVLHCCTCCHLVLLVPTIPDLDTYAPRSL